MLYVIAALLSLLVLLQAFHIFLTYHSQELFRKWMLFDMACPQWSTQEQAEKMERHLASIASDIGRVTPKIDW